jgi:hypothetical protein
MAGQQLVGMRQHAAFQLSEIALQHMQHLRGLGQRQGGLRVGRGTSGVISSLPL